MTARKAVKCKSEVGLKRGQSEGGRGCRNRMIGQMVTEIASEAKAGHFAGLVPVILPLLDGRSSHRNGTTGDPNELAHPLVNDFSGASMQRIGMHRPITSIEFRRRYRTQSSRQVKTNPSSGLLY